MSKLAGFNFFTASQRRTHSRQRTSKLTRRWVCRWQFLPDTRKHSRPSKTSHRRSVGSICDSSRSCLRWRSKRAARLSWPLYSRTMGDTPSTVGGSELDQLRASVQDMDFKLQSIANERDALKTEFNDYRQATQADQRDLEKENQRLRSDLLTTGQELSLRIAAQGQLGPLPDFNEDSSPQDKTEALTCDLRGN
jgi:hypothetical protein